MASGEPANRQDPAPARRETRGRPRLSAERLGLGLIEARPGVALHDQVYEALCRAIMVGAVRPQQQLSVRSLADEFGVSATPVKEALRRLGADEVLFALPKSSFRVTDITARRYAELLEIRKRLEGYAAEEAARLASRELIDRLALLNDRFRASQDLPHPAMLELNLEFHFTLYAAARKPDLMVLIRGLWLRIGPYLGYYEDTSTESSYQTHARIVDALRRGDARAAGAAVCDDLEHAARVILAKLDDSPADEPQPRSQALFPLDPASRRAPPARRPRPGGPGATALLPALDDE